MDLSRQEMLHLERRSRILKYWSWAGSALLIILLLLTGWLWIEVPYFINPVQVIAELESDALPVPVMTAMAALLPIVVLALLLLILVMIIFAFIVFSNEKKLIDIIQREVVKPEQ